MTKLISLMCLLLLAQIGIAQKITSTTVYFSSGKATLTKEAKSKIQALLMATPQNVDLQVEIYSFTDDVEKDNGYLELSQDRGDNVLDYLLQTGLNVKLSHLFDGGSTNQEVPNLDGTWRTQNRRTTIIISALVPIEETYLAYERENGVLPQKEVWVDPYTINGREYFTNTSPKKQQKVIVKPQ
ncbi:MAG: OmpA family protein [Bacteroidia bacterium]